MYKILDNLAVHVFSDATKRENVQMKYVEAEFGYIDDFKIIDVRMLSESGENKSQDYDLNILRVTSELDQGSKVVICCEAWQTTNILIALGVLIRYFRMNFHDALDLVKKKAPSSTIDPSKIKLLQKGSKEPMID